MNERQIGEVFNFLINANNGNIFEIITRVISAFLMREKQYFTAFQETPFTHFLNMGPHNFF